MQFWVHAHYASSINRTNVYQPPVRWAIFHPQVERIVYHPSVGRAPYQVIIWMINVSFIHSRVGEVSSLRSGGSPTPRSAMCFDRLEQKIIVLLFLIVRWPSSVACRCSEVPQFELHRLRSPYQCIASADAPGTSSECTPQRKPIRAKPR